MYKITRRPTFIGVIALLLFLFVLGSFAPFFQVQIAQAQTFEQHIPAFGLYCKDKEVIQAGNVKYDLTNAESVAQGKGTLQSNYNLSAVNHMVEFAIPFISSATNVPSFSVTTNEQKTNGSIWYGATFFRFDDTNFETLIDDMYSSDIDENLNGTLYTITPDNETITVDLAFAEGKKTGYIYDTSNNSTSSITANGTCTWTLKNAFAKSEYIFFILGETSDHSFSCNSKYKTETITCKAFIDYQFEISKEFYNAYSMGVDFFYSMVNRLLQNKQSMGYDDLFVNSIYTLRFNVYKFSLNIDKDTVISYELPINIQRNFAFTPTIYLVEQKNLGKYSIHYTAELNSEISYFIETNAKTEKNGTTYSTETAEDYYFVFCSSQKPESATLLNNKNDNTTLIICCYVISGIAFIVLIVIIIFALYQKVKSK